MNNFRNSNTKVEEFTHNEQLNDKLHTEDHEYAVNTTEMEHQKLSSQTQEEHKSEKPSEKRCIFKHTHYNGETKAIMMFLSGYFTTIAGSFIVALLYNLTVTLINKKLDAQIEYIDATNILLIVTAVLGTGLGVVLGVFSKIKESQR